ncbi:hypothetical protein [Marinomonas sp. THO17]|uniref:hypothetical protein n=1 Tax=Marinomonas sp. THO17 TaxID=3149048 RepID=UPI00336C1B8B
MRESILLQLSLLTGSSWANAIIAFIESNETQLVSDQPGNYTAGDLLAELKIRSKSVRDSGIESVGMIEFQNTLATLSEDQLIQNYIFKGEGKTGIVYLDGKAENVLGAVLVIRS